MLLRKISATALTVVMVAALFALGVQQVFALKKLRAEKRAFFALRGRVERATAPGEIVVVESNLAMPFYAYGSDALRSQLRSFLGSFPDVPPVYALQPSDEAQEMVYVGDMQDRFASSLLRSGYGFREYQPAQPQESQMVAHYYQVAGAGIYFVSPPAKDPAAAVSSKP